MIATPPSTRLAFAYRAAALEWAIKRHLLPWWEARDAFLRPNLRHPRLLALRATIEQAEREENYAALEAGWGFYLQAVRELTP